MQRDTNTACKGSGVGQPLHLRTLLTNPQNGQSNIKRERERGREGGREGGRERERAGERARRVVNAMN